MHYAEYIGVGEGGGWLGGLGTRREGGGGHAPTEKCKSGLIYTKPTFPHSVMKLKRQDRP